MPIEPIKIPQNVYIEDRIVGPLTLRQVIIVALGGGFSYALWASISKAYGIVAIPLQILVWIPGVLSLIFAFVKINDLSMLRLCMLFIERMNKPTTRTWTPRRGIVINVRTFHTAKEETGRAPTPTIGRELSAKKFDELSTVLDQQSKNDTKLNVPNMPELMQDEPEDDLEKGLTEKIGEPVKRPVDPSRIAVSPLNGNSVDSVVPTSGSVSLFRDISPAR